ncbi:MAG: 2-C-methyl-D-erythritol 2,4-cyclodiphosphate synthase [Candidatus Omnitrophica bacterium CG1_02_46_14]|nr:MAG: 2-C-methyl-D-erythritol 2,4-cyclodiphosphate synthase [Candidatus Omnitrophica bacterium CG1_02_46_14]
MAVGIGYDIHALKKGRKLILGGVAIPHLLGLVGHSDGDVLLHAIVDAVLGALGAGDIGEHFSDQEAQYRDADSLVFVRKTLEILTRKKFKIRNIDSTIIAEDPKLTPYKKSIQENVAKMFGIASLNVNIKAKTNEGFGAVGQKQAIACFAVVELFKASLNKR